MTTDRKAYRGAGKQVGETRQRHAGLLERPSGAAQLTGCREGNKEEWRAAAKVKGSASLSHTHSAHFIIKLHIGKKVLFDAGNLCAETHLWIFRQHRQPSERDADRGRQESKSTTMLQDTQGARVAPPIVYCSILPFYCCFCVHVIVNISESYLRCPFKTNL